MRALIWAVPGCSFTFRINHKLYIERVRSLLGDVRISTDYRFHDAYKVFFFNFTKKVFLVGSFPLREKCPTIAVTVFFLQTVGPLFRNNSETTKPPKAKSGQGKLSPKGPTFHFFQGNLQKRMFPWIFFGSVTFFRKFFIVPKRSPPSSFLIFCNGMYVNKSRRVPLLHFLELCDFF